MKTRCRSYGAKQRMTVDSTVVSTHNNSGRKDQSTFDSTEDILNKEPHVIHETRSQKHAKVNGQQGEHAETKDPSLPRPDLFTTNIRAATRSSARPSKRQKKSNSSPQSSVNQDGHQLTANSATKCKQKKVKRQWESWGLKDKNAFFDALHEHGKDFDKIQVNLATKHKRRGDPVNMIKNKEQVRHFYYRTLNKIIKFIPDDKQPTAETDPHRRTVLELGGLTCYGELRKKVGGLGDKQGKKLQELISCGRTAVRHNGRTVRLKAPTCRALKKLNLADTNAKFDDTSSVPAPVPIKLEVEFLPIDNATWSSVQRMAKNPRLKMTVLSKKPLHVILAFLMKKWPVKSPTCKSNETLSPCIAIPLEFLTSEDNPDSYSEMVCNVATADIATADIATANIATADIATAYIASKVCDNAECETDNVAGIAGDNLNAADNVETLSNGQVCDSHLVLGLANDNLHGNALSKSNECDSSSAAGLMEESSKLWTLETCGSITLADIYCQLQRPSKLKFRYAFEKDEISTTKHGNNALQKLVDVAKNEFYNIKRRRAPSRNTSRDGDVMPAPSATRTTRIAPKTTDHLPFILPSIVPPALRHGVCQQGIATPSTSISSTNPSSNFVNTRKRPRKNQLPVTQPQAVVQRTLLPRPVNAMPRGAVAVSFIPQPLQTVKSVPSPGSVNGLSGDSISKPGQGLAPIPLSPGNILTSTTQATLLSSSSITPISSPAPDTIITTVLETGMQQQTPQDLLETTPGAPNDNNTEKSLSADLTDISYSAPMNLPGINQLVSSFQPFTSSNPNGLDIDLSTNSNNNTLQLDPVVSMNEDSGSELLASIMGALDSTSTCNSSRIGGKIPVVQEQDLNITSPSFSTTSFHNLISSNNDTIMSVTTSTARSLFFNSGSDNSSDAFPINSNDKMYLSPTNGAGALFTSPHLSPIRMTSPTPDSQWINGEGSDISLSFLEKMTVSPDKDPKYCFEVPSTSNKDSQDSLFGSKSMIETLQSERALQAIMDENSVDFVKKFEDLAKQISSTDKPLVFGTENSSESSNSSSGIFNFKNLLGKQDK